LPKLGLASLPVACNSGTDRSQFDAFQLYNLDYLNCYRCAAQLPPYRLDRGLSDFSIAASTEYSQDHNPHAYFISHAISLALTYGGGAENQGPSNGVFSMDADPTASEFKQIELVVDLWYGSNDGHYGNMMSTEYTRLGSGLVEVGGLLYMTNDFVP
jgi:uncharacterized protein YkwD